MNCDICLASSEHIRRCFKDIFECDRCKARFVWPQPSPQRLEELYQQEYYTNSESASAGYMDYEGDRVLIKKTFERRLAQIETLYPQRGKILDLGCATGFFLEVAKERGWEAYGIDISSYATSVAAHTFGDKITTAALEDASFPAHYFDVITGWDYIEHVLSPRNVIEKCASIIKPGGLIALATPDITSFSHSIFKERWMGYKKDHLFYFSPQSLTGLLEENNFSIERTCHIGKYISLDWFLNRLHVYTPSLANVGSVSMRLLRMQKFSFYLNPFDITLVIARSQNGKR